MKKKSKVIMIGSAVGAMTLFTATAFAYSPNTEGYDAFKAMLKANPMSGAAIESATVNGNFTVTVDGETVLKADGSGKMGEAGGEYNVSGDLDFTLMGVERNASLYSSGDDKVYLVDRTHDLHYQVINLDDERAGEHREWSDEEEFQDRPMNKAEEALLDFMVGDLKDNFSVANQADGSKTITVDISKEDIPLPLRLLMDAASAEDRAGRALAPEAHTEWDQLSQLPFFQGLEGIDLEAQLPELTEDVAIEHVRLQMTVDANNEVQGVQGELEVSGKDEAGIAHRVELEGAGHVSDINATTPEAYDPAGKSVEIIDAATFDDRS
ncbi:hypothetical protein [Cohnella thailandensis]|uniref:DUF4179 domain-containing protein n=1 Tax=Cohnella thailandensis TaxID=557557 RepID=A0A841ST61_9BACL|nr:hypothetical protein [Cohnella thailandensis]MBB6633100.1 hypothetical protein [Cohnella thailandensis]MBP1975205.1 hypothetical protein [Cohnella thailandensis]